MASYFDDGRPSRAHEGLADSNSNGGEYCDIETNNNEPYPTVDYVGHHTQYHLPISYQQTPQMTMQYGVLPTAVLYQDHRLEEDKFQGYAEQVDEPSPQYINPAFIETSEPQETLTPDFQHGDLYCAPGIFDSGYGGDSPDAGGRDSEMFAYPHMQSGQFVTSSTTFNIQGSPPTGSPDMIFFAGVLGRLEGYQENLGTSTAEIMDHLALSHSNTQMHPRSNLSPTTQPSSYSECISRNQATIVAPQPLQVIQAQRSSEAGSGGPLREFQYVVRESTPVVVDQTMSGARSGSTSNGQLHPCTGSQMSDMASPTNTDTSLDTLYCPFDSCESKFTGEYRKGNLGRHHRQKHAGQIVEYRCKDEYCTRVFRRKDARLKHSRKAHPYLNVSLAVSRKSSTTGSD